jgi:hypothetical protein
MIKMPSASPDRLTRRHWLGVAAPEGMERQPCGATSRNLISDTDPAFDCNLQNGLDGQSNHAPFRAGAVAHDTSGDGAAVVQ